MIKTSTWVGGEQRNGENESGVTVFCAELPPTQLGSLTVHIKEQSHSCHVYCSYIGNYK